jgi:phosphomannomutase
MATADRAHSNLIIANDPDSDRLAIAERLPSGEWKIFTGNEIGIVFAAWVWSQFHSHNPAISADKCVLMNSTVSSKMLASLAKHEGLVYDETLTGFKWMGTKAAEYAAKGLHTIFAFEEAIGFMIGDVCRDKDGIRAAAVMGELYQHLQARHTPLSVTQYLDTLYEKYGYFETRNRYFFCYDPAVMTRIFDEIRNGGKYPTRVGEFPVKAIRDLTKGIDTRPAADIPSHLPITPAILFITFYVETGGCATGRGCVTEPKLKYYVELRGSDRAAVSKNLARMVESIITQCLQPSKFDLKPPAD